MKHLNRTNNWLAVWNLQGPNQQADFLFPPENPENEEKRITTIKVVNDKIFTVYDSSIKMKIFE